MYSKILILHFPKTEVKKPVVCGLAKDYDLTFNILNATVLPRKEGRMVIDLSGDSKEDVKKGIKYLKEQKVRVQYAEQEITRDEENCIHCGACTAVCPTGALSVKRPEMTVVFDVEKCSVCEHCVPTCLTHCMKARPKTDSVFE